MSGTKPNPAEESNLAKSSRINQELLERILNRDKQLSEMKRKAAEEEKAAAAEQKDVVEQIGEVFERLENKENRAIYTQSPQSQKSRTDLKKQRESKKSKVNLMKAFVNAPFKYQEAFLSLRTNIKFLSENKEYKKIIVTSSIPDEGKSSIAINLALALSAANNNVIIVDADLRKPSIHNYLQLKDGLTMGLTNILYDKDDVNKSYIRRNVDGKGLAVIPCGVVPPNPTEILGSQRMGQMLDVLGKHYDYVIIDTPPVSIVTDAAVLSRYADGVLLVVKQKYATFEQARRAKKNLDTVNANILGVVINDFNYKRLDKTSEYSYYHYERY